MRRHPLQIVATWDDACTRTATVEWDGTFETAKKVAEVESLYRGRQTVGFLIYVNAEAVWLAHDYDEHENQVGNLTIIPLGWVTKITSARGTVLYRRAK